MVYGDTWKVPKIDINGVSLPAQSITWALTAGVMPFFTDFVVDRDSAEELKQLPNPVYLHYKLTGGTSGRPEPLEFSFANLYLFDPRAVDPWHVQFTLADARWAWRGKKIYCSYNKTRLKNEPGVNLQNPLDPQTLRDQVDRFSVGRYLGWSIPSEGEGSPWNVYGMLVDQLGKLGIAYSDNVNASKNSYVIENVEMHGIDIYQGLMHLLSLSRLQMGIDNTGLVYIYSLDFMDENQVDLKEKFSKIPAIGPGRFFKKDLSKIRPKKVSVRFEKKQEIWLVASDTSETYVPDKEPIYRKELAGVRTAEDIDNWKVLGCQNVLPVTYPIKIDNKIVNVGEWVPMPKYLAALGITDLQVRTGFFSNFLTRQYASTLPGGIIESNERLAQIIIGNIKAHYRKTYQIDPYFCNRMEFWETRRCSIINNYDHYSPPSPVFADCTFIPVLRHPGLARKVGTWGNNVYCWLVDTDDPYRVKPNSGTIHPISQEFGIFQVGYPPSVEGMMLDIYPYAMSPKPKPGANQTDWSLQKSVLNASHTFETIITVNWAVSRQQDFGGKTKYFIIEQENPESEGPETEYLCQLEYARYPISTPSISLSGYPVIQTDNKMPSNLQLLHNIAGVEIAKILNQYRDRSSGICVFPGYVQCNLNGTIKKIVYSFTENAGLRTIIDAREIPPIPTIEQGLSQKEINYLRKHVTRGDTVSEVKK